MFQSGHRRGRSLCEELTLEETEKGVLVVSGINDSSANQRLQKGDEIVGATIHFDELSKADVLKLLKLIEPFDEKVELLSKKTKKPSKSLGALDRCVKAPEEMLKDSYNRLYHDKIKKFIKDNMCVGAGEGSINREFKPRLKDNIGQGMDTNTTRVDAPNFIHSPVILNDPRGENLLHVERPDIDIKTYVNPLNIDTPSTDLKMPGLEQTHISNGLDVSLPKADLTVPVLDLTAQKDKIRDKSCYPEESTITFTALDIYSPKLDTEGTAKKLKIPNLKMQDFGLSGQNIKRPGCKVMTSDLSLPRVMAQGDDLTKSKLDLNAPYVSMQTPKRVQSYKKNPDLNVDDPSGYLEVSKVRLSAREPKGIDNDTVFKTTDIDIKSPLIDIHDPRLLNADLPSVDAIRLQTPDITSGIFGIQSNKKPQMDLISPDVLHDGPFELDLSGTLLKRSDLDIDVNTLTPKAPQIKDGIYLSNTSLTKVDTKFSKLDMNTPDVDLNYPSGNFIKMPNIKVPKCGLSKPQEQNNVQNLAEPTITLSPKVEKEMSSPNFDISTVGLTCPDIDDSPSGKFKIMDSFKMSDNGFFGPKVTGPDCEFIPDCDLSAPQQKGEINRLDLNASDYLKGTEIDLTAPDLNINMPSVSFPTFNKPDSKLSDSGIKAKFRMPKLFGTLSKKTPELSLEAPTMKSGIDVPDLPKANLKELDLGTNTSNIDTDPLKGTLNIPKLRMPNFELPGQRRTRNVDITGHDARPNLTKGLHIDTYGGMGSSNADTKTPRVNLKGPKMGLQLPDIDLGSPLSKLQKPDLKINIGVKSPDLSLKEPYLKGGIDVSDLDLPNMDVKAPQLDLNTPNVDIGSPQTKFKIPKLKMPKFGISGLKGPSVDIDGALNAPAFNIPDLHLSDPKLKGRINPPDLKLPTANLKGPKLDVNAPNMNLKMPSGKLNVPTLKKPEAELSALDFDVYPPSGKLKMPSFDFLGKEPKRPNMDIDTGLKTRNLSLKAPHMKGGIDISDLDLPNMDVKAPQLDLNTPNVDIGSPQTKFKIPKLKMPKFGISGLKGPSVDIDGALNAPAFNIPDLHLSDPKLKGRINPPDLKLPTANLKGPKLDVNAPNMNLKMPSGKLNVPTLKKPKVDLSALDFDVDPPSGKLKMPSFGFLGKEPKRPNMDIDTGLKTPNLSLKDPHMKGGIDVSDLDLPNIDVKAPQLDLNTPNVDIGSPQTKFKIPKLKMPKFGISGLKGPSVDIDGALNAPAFNIPDLHLSDPKLKGRINPPDLKLPTANLKGPKLDVNAPNMNLKMPSGKLNVPTLKKPEAELSALDFDVYPPSGKLKMPSFDFLGKEPKRPNMDIDTGLKTRNLSLKAPHMKGGIDISDLDLPNMDVKAPQLDLNTPNVDIGSPQTKFKIPKLKMPKFGISGLKGPSVDIDGALNAPAFNIPDLHLSDPKLKGRINPPDLKLPTANLKGPKLDVNAPNTNLKMPSGKLNVPTLKKPKAELSALDFDVYPPSGKLKMPSFDFLGKEPKRPNMDIDTGLKTRNLSLKAPHMKGGIDISDLDLPNMDVKAPQLDLNTPNVDIGSPQTKFKIPKLKMPKFGISGLKGPSVDIDGALNAPAFNIPDLHLSDPKLKGRKKNPDVKLPTANLKGPKLDVNAPNMNLKMPSGKLNVPTLKKPKVELSALDFDVDPPSGKLKISSFGFSGKQPKRANMDIDTGLKTPNLSLKAPHMKGDIDVPDLDLPNIDVKAPQLDLNTPNVDIGTPKTKFKTPKLKMPKFGISDRKGPSVDIDGDLNAPAFNIPDIHLSDPKLKGRINHPDLKLPTANLNGPKLDVNAPNMNFRGLDLTSTGSDIDFGTVMTSRSPDMNISLPKAKLDVKDVKDNLARTKLSPPRNSTSFVDNGVDLRLANLNAASNPKMYVPKSYEKELVNLNLGNNVDSQGRESHKEAAVNEIDQTKMRRTKMQGPQKSEYEKCMLNFTNDNKSPEDFEGYYVTVFPKQLKENVRGQTGVAGSKESNQRSHTHGGLDFTASSLDLEVPEQNDLKGSTFWFSKLI
ncbi:neuroblast differentiation-associated protein AHNAK isoform X2 [Osmerus mordax]